MQDIGYIFFLKCFVSMSIQFHVAHVLTYMTSYLTIWQAGSKSNVCENNL